MNNIDPDVPFLTIAAASDLARMHPQTLRQYDRMGLVKPSRTVGQSRRYTLRNVAQLAEIAKLSAEGGSLVAIKRILELENKVVALKAENKELQEIAIKTEKSLYQATNSSKATAMTSLLENKDLIKNWLSESNMTHTASLFSWQKTLPI